MAEAPPADPRARAAAPGGLLRILGVAFGLAVIVGSTLGIGILRTPGLVAGQLASPSKILLVWLVGGLYTLLGAVCLTELGTMLPQAGGYYVYARRAFGDTVGFAVGWSDWITYCAVLGYVTIAMGEFTAVLIPSLTPAIKLVAVAVLVCFAALQWAGLRLSSRFQEVTTAVKFLAFLALVAACFVHAASSPVAPAPAADLPRAGLVGLVIALQSVAITFGGWQSALYFTEEDSDPRRNLPRSMIGGVVSVLVIYLLVNVALLAVLPVADLARSTLPAADAAKVIFGGRGGQIITVLSLVSLPPLVNAIMMIGTRILFAMGRDGLLWRRAGAVSQRGTPLIAALVTTAVAVVLIGSGTFQTLVAVASFFLAVNYCVSCLALIALRRREPLMERPCRAWGYPWSVAVVLAGAVAFLIGVLMADTRTALVATGLLAVGLLGKAMGVRLTDEEGKRVLVVLALASVCCAHHHKVLAPDPEGKTSVRVLNAPETPPGGGSLPAPPAERITPAYASPDNKLPEYPLYALKAGCGQGVVAVRVHINAEGNVSAQRDVPGHPLPADECHMAFRAAVQSAVNTWKFAPAFRQTPIVDPATDARAPVLHWKQEPVAIYLDFEFTFEIVAGKGVVRTR